MFIGCSPTFGSRSSLAYSLRKEDHQDYGTISDAAPLAWYLIMDWVQVPHLQDEAGTEILKVRT